MEEDNQVSMLDLIKNLFHSSYKLVNDTLQLVGLEARLAGKSLKSLFILAIVQIVILMTIWLGLNAMLVCFLVSLTLSWLTAISLDTLLNILILILIACRMHSLKDNITFPATRRQLLRDPREK